MDSDTFQVTREPTGLAKIKHTLEKTKNMITGEMLREIERHELRMEHLQKEYDYIVKQGGCI